MSDEMNDRRGQAFPAVALPGAGHMLAKGVGKLETALESYLAAACNTKRPLVGVRGDGGFGQNFALSSLN